MTHQSLSLSRQCDPARTEPLCAVLRLAARRRPARRSPDAAAAGSTSCTSADPARSTRAPVPMIGAPSGTLPPELTVGRAPMCSPADAAAGLGGDLSQARAPANRGPGSSCTGVSLSSCRTADDRPSANQVWCADITYIPVQDGSTSYLVATHGLGVAGGCCPWRLSNTLDTEFCLEACGRGRSRVKALRDTGYFQHRSGLASSPVSSFTGLAGGGNQIRCCDATVVVVSWTTCLSSGYGAR